MGDNHRVTLDYRSAQDEGRTSRLAIAALCASSASLLSFVAADLLAHVSSIGMFFGGLLLPSLCTLWLSGSALVRLHYAAPTVHGRTLAGWGVSISVLSGIWALFFGVAYVSASC
jgi:hypothetical protein